MARGFSNTPEITRKKRSASLKKAWAIGIKKGGWHQTEEAKKKIGIFFKGKPKSKEHTEKFVKGGEKTRFKKGHVFSYWTGKKQSAEQSEKKRVAMAGKTPKNIKIFVSGGKKTQFKKGNTREKCVNWRGGLSFEPYGLEFNNNLKEVIRERDKRLCKMCGKRESENGELMSVHHIDYNKKNNNHINLITLCRVCHTKTNANRKYWLDFFKNYRS